MSVGATMQAAVLKVHREPFHMQTIARPQPTRGQVLVHIEASGINPLDTVCDAYRVLKAGKASGTLIVDIGHTS